MKKRYNVGVSKSGDYTVVRDFYWCVNTFHPLYANDADREAMRRLFHDADYVRHDVEADSIQEAIEAVAEIVGNIND